MIGAFIGGIVAGAIGFALGDRRRARLEQRKAEQNRALAEFGRKFLP